MADVPPVTLSIPQGLGGGQVAALRVCLSAMVGPATDGPLADGPVIPVIAPALLLGHPALAQYAGQMQPPAGMGMVHESQSFSGAGGITSQTPLLISPDVTIRGASRVFGFALQLGIEGTPATMQTRLRQVSPADMAGFKGSVFPPHMDMGDVDWQTSQPFGRAAVRDYLAQARDSNPIHVDDDAARALGLEAAVVPGMFIAGVAEFMVWHALPDARLEGMKLRFMAPVLVGACLRYGVLVRSKSKQGRPKAVRVFILRRDNVIAAIADLDMQDDR